MYNDIRLFIEGREVEFSTTPQILYNYNVTDFTNPTIIQNSYSKTITIEGTPANNDLFGHIWRADRYQSYSGGAPSFNPLKRADFLLFVNGELYEKGYARLNGIKRKGQTEMSYEITLFGGIGGLFYSLSTIAGSDRAATLADLVYKLDGGTEPDLSFEISKETVDDAWTRIIMGGLGDSKWDVLNFAVTSEGVPEDFDASKVLINTYGNNTFTRSKDGCKPVLNGAVNDYGYVLGEVNYELTCDNTFDLRSYLLRPVISGKRILEAMKNPDVNGGYELKFDTHFFNSQNPYYEDCWMTLPMLRELKVDRQLSQTVQGTITTTSDWHWSNLSFNSPFATSANALSLDVILSYTPTSSTNATNLYSYSHLTTDDSGGAPTTYIKEMEVSSGAIFQLFAYDEGNNEVARSKAYVCATDQHQAGSDSALLAVGYEYRMGTQFVFLNGHFEKKNGQFVFCDNDGNTQAIHFEFGNIKYSTLKFFLQTPYSEYRYFTTGVFGKKYQAEYHIDAGPTQQLHSYESESVSGRYTPVQARAYKAVPGRYGLIIDSLEVSAMAYASLFSHTRITKDKLLATEYTPADWLLSYMKTFGLYAYQNPTEEASDPIRYPNGVVHIVDRDTFYTNKVVNLQQVIDRGKESNTKPVLAETKYYAFENEPINSEAQEKYLNTYGHNYGTAIVDTGLEFNNDTTQLYDGTVFKSGVMVQEKNRFFNRPNNGIPVYAYGGMKYHLFKAGTNGWDTTEIDYPRIATDPQSINSENLDFYDSFPKFQVHTEDLGSNDGKDVLLFYNGIRGGSNVNYWITDDLEDMATLNDGSPCWIMTTDQYNYASQMIAVLVTSVPYFTRDIVRAGNIVHTWNFGHPRETYIPETVSTNGDCIYDKCWKDYINDIFDVNTRSTTVFVKLWGRPNPDWLRNFYWFDNAIWRINSIKDWNLSSLETTQVEFVKVQDIANYSLAPITDYGAITISLDSYTIGQAGGQLTGSVTCQSANMTWSFLPTFTAVDQLGNEISFTSSSYINPLSGGGLSTSIRINVPDNQGLTDRTFTVTLQDGQGNRYSVSFIQEANNAPLIAFTTQSASFDFQGGQVNLPFISRFMDASTLAVSYSQSWAVPSLLSNSVLVDVSTNTSESTRTATIVLSGLSDRGIRLSTTATITQTGAGLTISPSSIVFDFWEGADAEFTITSDGPWTAEINDNQ